MAHVCLFLFLGFYAFILIEKLKLGRGEMACSKGCRAELKLVHCRRKHSLCIWTSTFSALGHPGHVLLVYVSRRYRASYNTEQFFFKNCTLIWTEMAHLTHKRSVYWIG